MWTSLVSPPPPPPNVPTARGVAQGGPVPLSPPVSPRRVRHDAVLPLRKPPERRGPGASTPLLPPPSTSCSIPSRVIGVQSEQWEPSPPLGAGRPPGPPGSVVGGLWAPNKAPCSDGEDGTGHWDGGIRGGDGVGRGPRPHGTRSPTPTHPELPQTSRVEQLGGRQGMGGSQEGGQRPQKGTRRGRGALHGASTLQSPPSPGGVAQGAPQQRLCGVAVITSALHAEGPGFEPQRSHPTRIFCAFSPSAPFTKGGGTWCHLWGGAGSPHNAPPSPWGGK